MPAAMNSYCIRLSEINPPDLVFYLPLARNVKLQFGAFLLVAISACSVTQGPDVKTKLKIKKPKLKQDLTFPFRIIFNTGQFSCFNACLHRYLYWHNQGAFSRREQAWSKERLVPSRGGNICQTFLTEFFICRM